MANDIKENIIKEYSSTVEVAEVVASVAMGIILLINEVIKKARSVKGQTDPALVNTQLRDVLLKVVYKLNNDSNTCAFFDIEHMIAMSFKLNTWLDFYKIGIDSLLNIKLNIRCGIFSKSVALLSDITSEDFTNLYKDLYIELLTY